MPEARSGQRAAGSECRVAMGANRVVTTADDPLSPIAAGGLLPAAG